MPWIINTTFHVNKRCEDEFLRWLKDEMVPTVKSFGHGVSYTYCLEIMVELAENMEGYAIQMNCETFDDVKSWLESPESLKLAKSLRMHFGEKVLAFNSFMRIFHF